MAKPLPMNTDIFGSMPGYWMHETSGVLAPAVYAFLDGGPMTPTEIAALRAYLRQWIAAPGWLGGTVDALRASVDGLTTREAISAWIDVADTSGIDPL